jgi:hypothetical protein
MQQNHLLLISLFTSKQSIKSPAPAASCVTQAKHLDAAGVTDWRIRVWSTV